jgi:hypothetical protein
MCRESEQGDLEMQFQELNIGDYFILRQPSVLTTKALLRKVDDRGAKLMNERANVYLFADLTCEVTRIEFKMATIREQRKIVAG